MCKAAIRAAEAGDIHELMKIELWGFEKPWSLETLQQELGNHDRTHYVVADIQGQVIGYAGLWIILDEGHITRIAVDPKFRRRGIGGDLVKALMEAGANSGCQSFTLEVMASNIGARKLYKDLGFEEVGFRPGYYEMEEQDAVIMWYHPPEYIREGAQNERR
ncbi:MAG: ribosomal protein S18-alanine N-acetyltransferase [Anaerovoracaceae bacterium]|jgi:ribosomal-protein-alanine N-acetyltransferase|nr:ribosomal protein S18-alanine N-acetyltransferase [Anaerovoracaceae bacterium]